MGVDDWLYSVGVELCYGNNRDAVMHTRATCVMLEA